jgi:hypothetical protein
MSIPSPEGGGFEPNPVDDDLQRLRELMPGVEDRFLVFFETALSEGRAHPVIKPMDQIAEETGLDPGMLKTKTQAAHLARLQELNLPPSRSTALYSNALHEIQMALRHSLSGWPISVVDIFLQDPALGRIYSEKGLQMLARRYKMNYHIGRAEHRPVTLEIPRLNQGDREPSKYFNHDPEVGAGEHLGSNIDQLRRRMENFYIIMNPRSN